MQWPQNFDEEYLKLMRNEDNRESRSVDLEVTQYNLDKKEIRNEAIKLMTEV